MAVDSIGGRNSEAQVKAQKQSLAEERDRELERVERQYQEQVRKTQEAREKSLQDIYESQSSMIDGRQRDSDHKVERAKEAADHRIKTFEQESKRMTEEAQRQFQQKAARLTQNAEELDKQRKHLLAQHADSMKRVREEQGKTEREAYQQANRVANEAHVTGQKKLAALQNRSEIELQAKNDEFRQRKATQALDAEMELHRMQNERDLHRESLQQEVALNKKTAKEQQQYERSLKEKNLSNLQSEYDSQMREINRANRFHINSELLKNRSDLDATRERFSDEQRLMHKQHDQRIHEAENKQHLHLNNLEDQSKLQEHIMKKSFQYKKLRFKEEAEQNLEQYAEQNEKLRGDLENNYRTQSANLKDKYKKQFTDQETQLQRELKHQYVRGSSQINNLMFENSKDQMYVQKKAEDPFYNIQRLNPTLHDLGDEYVVNIKMSAHEQEHVRLSHQKGLLTVSNNRRFEGQSKTEDGQTIATNTYQSYSESLPITGKVDITKMRRSYDDGILSFRLPKILV